MFFLTIYSFGEIETLCACSIELLRKDTILFVVANNKKYFIDDFVIEKSERILFDSLWDYKLPIVYLRFCERGNNAYFDNI